MKKGVYHGRVDRIRDVITFESSTLTGLEREFRTSVDTYLDFCAEKDLPPEAPAERARAAS